MLKKCLQIIATQFIIALCERMSKGGLEMLKELRKEKGATQKQVADACEVTRATIAMIEIGKNQPSVKLAKRLAKFFDVEWTIFFN